MQLIWWSEGGQAISTRLQNAQIRHNNVWLRILSGIRGRGSSASKSFYWAFLYMAIINGARTRPGVNTDPVAQSRPVYPPV